MDTMRAAYDEVYVYTMGRPGFILQHVVDAFAVQPRTPPASRSALCSVWLAFISALKSIFRAVRSKKHTWSLDVENESGRRYICPWIGAP